MRNILIAAVALVASTGTAHAQFEDFIGSNAFGGFNGTTGNAGCISGASATAGGSGTTTCESAFNGDYSFNSFEQVVGAEFNQVQTGTFQTGNQSSYGIQSIWQSDSGPKTGGNTISALSGSVDQFGGEQTTAITGGVFNSGTSSTFNGWVSGSTTSTYTIAAPAPMVMPCMMNCGD